MLYLRAVCFWAVLVFLCSGCIVQSLNPHCANESRVALPEVVGKWQLVKELGNELKEEEKKAVSPWTIKATAATPPVYEVTSYDRGNHEAKLMAMFFALAGETYCNVTPMQPPSELSRYWNSNVYRVHVLFKVELKDDVLRLRFINREWMEKAIEAKEITFPVIQKARTLLLNATAAEWKAFLEKYGKTDGVFSDKNVMELRRTKDGEPGAEKKEQPATEPAGKKDL